MAWAFGETTRGSGLAMTFAMLVMAGMVLLFSQLTPREHSCDAEADESSDSSDPSGSGNEVFLQISRRIELLASGRNLPL
jgi:hypothetical protein